MSLECCYDPDYYVELSEELITSLGTEICIECKKLIYPGEEHYAVEEYIAPDWDCPWSTQDRTHRAWLPCCEACGDLALSWFELGYCWSYGDLRDDIKELNELLERA